MGGTNLWNHADRRPLFYAVAVPAVLLTGISKGGFGGVLGGVGTSFILAPLVPLGVRLGIRLQDRINLVWFYRISQACLFVTGIQWSGRAFDQSM